jgi:hypothetical protein
MEESGIHAMILTSKSPVTPNTMSRGDATLTDTPLLSTIIGVGTTICPSHTTTSRQALFVPRFICLPEDRPEMSSEK